MQLSTVLLAFATAVSAAPAPVPRLMSITNLYIDSIYAALAADYQVNVSYTGQTGHSHINNPSYNSSHLCSTTTTYAYAPSIDGFTDGTFDNPAFSWDISPDGSDKYVLDVSYTASGGQVYQGSRALPSSEFLCSGQSNIHGMDTEFCKGPKNFTLDVSQN